MSGIQESLRQANSVYRQSLSIDELGAEVKNLSQFLQQSWIDEENRADIESIICKVRIKQSVLCYFINKYQDDDYIVLLKRIESVRNISTKNNYPKTLELVNNLEIIIKQIHQIAKEYRVYENQMRDSFGERLLKTIEEYKKLQDIFNEKILLLKAIDNIEIFPAQVNIYSPLEQAIEDFENLYKEAESYISAMIHEDENMFLSQNTKNIFDVYKEEYMYCSDVDVEKNHYANALILNTPFLLEARLLVKNFAKTNKVNVSVVDASIFSNMSLEMLRQTFDVFKTRNINLLIENMSRYTSENKSSLFSIIMEYGKLGLHIFVIDEIGDNGIYKEFQEVCKLSENLTLLDISFVYLTMPSFNSLIELLIEDHFIDSQTDSRVNEIKIGMPFIGFVGLNELYRARAANKDWISKGCAISKKNYTNEVIRYLNELPTQTLLIDSFWGDFKTVDEVDIKVGDFDYDDIRYANPINVRKIIESKFNIFAKCGALVRYCLLCGDDISVWKELTREEQLKRIDEATRLVYRALTINDIVPVVELLDDLGGPIGLCCDGGKVIKYLYSAAQNCEGVMETICHESYHAFQHLVMERIPYSRWLFDEFGLYRGRITEWILNNQNYIKGGKSGKSYNAYRYQVMESDANAFQIECRDESGKIWNAIDFE